MGDLEGQLTDVENRHLESARKHQYEVYALEDYSRLWDELDHRLGKGNDLVKQLVSEYNERIFPRARDSEEDRRVQMMRSSFFFPRTDMPSEVRMALLAFDLFGRR